MHSPSQRAFALVGPGRAGTTIATALVARGLRCVAVAGRSADAPSTLGVAQRLGAQAVEVAGVGHVDGIDTELVIVATPDAEIAGTAAASPMREACTPRPHLTMACRA